MNEADLLGQMHELLLQAMRSREQEVLKYLAILAPALGGFVWLVYVIFWPSGSIWSMTVVSIADREQLFITGTICVLLLLFLGAVYSLALGYNYRYLNLQIAKIESRLNVKADMLRGWPKAPRDFERYVYCTLPAVIEVFWGIFYLWDFRRLRHRGRPRT